MSFLSGGLPVLRHFSNKMIDYIQMKLIAKNFVQRKGFSLAEILAVLIISSMIILAVLSLYGRLNKVSASVISNLEKGQLPREVLQLISEDLERILSDARDTKINFQNKIGADGIQSARLEIFKYIYDGAGNPVIFEQIVWQTGADSAVSPGGLVLYRRHNGLALEDKLLDEQRPDIENEKQLFIPVCTGVTFFSIQTATFKAGSIDKTADGKEVRIDTWSTTSLPQNIIAAISFAEPIETAPGQWEVPETDKTVRIIALDRTRKIPFSLAVMDLNEVNDLKPTVNTDLNIRDANNSNRNVTGR